MDSPLAKVTWRDEDVKAEEKKAAMDGELKNLEGCEFMPNAEVEISKENTLEPGVSEGNTNAFANLASSSNNEAKENVEGKLSLEAEELGFSGTGINTETACFVNRYPALSVSEKDWKDDDYYVPDRDGRKKKKGSSSELVLDGDDKNPKIIANENWESVAVDPVRPRVRVRSELESDTDEGDEGDEEEEEEEDSMQSESDDMEEKQGIGSSSGLEILGPKAELFSGGEEDSEHPEHDGDEDENDSEFTDGELSPKGNEGPNLRDPSSVSQGISIRAEEVEERAEIVESLNPKVLHVDPEDWEEEEEDEEEDEEEEEDGLNGFLEEAPQNAMHHEIPRAVPTTEHGEEDHDLFHSYSLRDAPLSAEHQLHLEEARSALLANQALSAQLEAERDQAKDRAAALEAVTRRLSEELNSKRRQLIGSAEVAGLAGSEISASTSPANMSTSSVAGIDTDEVAQLKSEVQRLQKELTRMELSLRNERHDVPGGQNSARQDDRGSGIAEGRHDEAQPKSGDAVKQARNSNLMEAATSAKTHESEMEIVVQLKKELEHQEELAREQAVKASIAQQCLSQAKQELETTREMLMAKEGAKCEMERELQELRKSVAASKLKVDSTNGNEDVSERSDPSPPGKLLPNRKMLWQSHGKEKSGNTSAQSSPMNQKDTVVEKELANLQRELQSLRSILSDAVEKFCLLGGEKHQESRELVSQKSLEELVKLLIHELLVLREEMKTSRGGVSMTDSELPRFQGTRPNEDYLKSIDQEADRLRKQAKATSQELAMERSASEGSETVSGNLHNNPLFSPELGDRGRMLEDGSSKTDASGIVSVKSLVRQYEKSTKLTKLEIEQWNTREKAARTEAQRLAVRCQLEGRLRSEQFAMGNPASPRGESAGEGEKAGQKLTAETNTEINPQDHADGVSVDDDQRDVPLGVAEARRRLDFLAKKSNEGNVDSKVKQISAPGAVSVAELDNRSHTSQETKTSSQSSLKLGLATGEAPSQPVPNMSGAMADRHLWLKLAALQQDLANAKVRASQLASGLRKARDSSASALIESEKRQALPKSRPLYTKQWSAAAVDKTLHETDQGKSKEPFRVRAARGV